MTRSMHNKSIVALRIKELRKEQGLTQMDLAEKTNISLQSIKNYECGRRTPDNYNLQILCNTFRVSESYLLGVSDFKNQWEQYDIEHQEENQQIQKELVFFEHCESLGCSIKELTDEQVNFLINKVNETIKSTYKDLTNGKGEQ